MGTIMNITCVWLLKSIIVPKNHGQYLYSCYRIPPSGCHLFDNNLTWNQFQFQFHFFFRKISTNEQKSVLIRFEMIAQRIQFPFSAFSTHFRNTENVPWMFKQWRDFWVASSNPIKSFSLDAQLIQGCCWFNHFFVRVFKSSFVCILLNAIIKRPIVCNCRHFQFSCLQLHISEYWNQTARILWWNEYKILMWTITPGRSAFRLWFPNIIEKKLIANAFFVPILK